MDATHPPQRDSHDDPTGRGPRRPWALRGRRVLVVVTCVMLAALYVNHWMARGTNAIEAWNLVVTYPRYVACARRAESVQVGWTAEQVRGIGAKRLVDAHGSVTMSVECVRPSMGSLTRFPPSTNSLSCGSYPTHVYTFGEAGTVETITLSTNRVWCQD